MAIIQRTVRFDETYGNTCLSEKQLHWVNEQSLIKAVEARVVGLYPDYTFQTMEGWGCAMTEASCYLLSQMTAENRQAALAKWFGPTGMNARFIRMHIDSCDYCLSEYQAVADPLADPELNTFSINRDRQWILPIVKEALALADGHLQVLLSPWSPPYQWKTPPEFSQNDAAVYGGTEVKIDTTQPGRCFGGRLKKEYYPSWARYLVKFIQAYLAEGIPVGMLSLQNEASAATSWDSCLWSGEEEREFLKNHLYPELEKAGLAGKIAIFIWDHNKERAIEHIDAFMADAQAAEKVDGFAFHWYSGDHFEALDLLHRRYPDKFLMHTESCPLHMPGKILSMSPGEDGVLNNAGDEAASLLSPQKIDHNDAIAYAHDIIGDLNHGMQGWMDWNMIVDQNGGPRHVTGGFGAPLVYEENGSCRTTIMYEYLKAIASAFRPGAVRIGKSVFGRDVEAAACRNKDGSYGLILLNQARSDLSVNIRMAGKILLDVALPAESLSALCIEAE